MTQGEHFAHLSLISSFQSPSLPHLPSAFKMNNQVTYMKIGPLKTVSFVTAAHFSFEVMNSIMLVFIFSDVKENSLWLNEIYSMFLLFPRHLCIQAA